MDLAKKQIQRGAATHRAHPSDHALYTARQMSHRDKPMSPQRHREWPGMPRIVAVPEPAMSDDQAEAFDLNSLSDEELVEQVTTIFTTV